MTAEETDHLVEGQKLWARDTGHGGCLYSRVSWDQEGKIER